MYTCNDAAPREKADGTATAVRPGATERPPRMRHMRYAVAHGARPPWAGDSSW